MNAEHTKYVLQQQCKLGRRVALLLAYLSEHGATHIDTLAAVMPSGIRGEVALANQQDYIIAATNDRYLITTKGREVVSWLMGYRLAPSHWKVWEAEARKRQSTVKVLTRRSR